MKLGLINIQCRYKTELRTQLSQLFTPKIWRNTEDNELRNH